MSSATIVLAPKVASIAFVEKPVSGRTLPGDLVEQGVWPQDKSVISTNTWTNSLIARFLPAPQQVRMSSVPAFETASNSAGPGLTSQEFGSTLERLRELLTEDEEQDRPSGEAFERVVTLLRETAKTVGMSFPGAVAGTGPGRSVRLLWRENEKELRIVIGGTAQNRSYIYWRHSGGSGVDSRIDSSRFAQYLFWLSKAV